METGYNIERNILIGFTMLKFNALLNTIWYVQTKYNHHIGGYIIVNTIGKRQLT